MLVDPGRGHQVRQPVEQLQRSEDQLGLASDGGPAQTVDQVLIIEAAEALLGQGRAGAVSDQALQPMAVPVRDRYRRID